VNPENQLVYAMTRMDPDDKFKEFNKEAMDLLQGFRKECNPLEGVKE